MEKINRSNQSFPFKRCKDLKDKLVRAKLHSEGAGVPHNRGCTLCGKSRCQVCNVICDIDTFTSHITDREYKINFFVSL